MNKKVITCFVILAILIALLEISLLKEYYVHAIIVLTFLFLMVSFLIWYHHSRRFQRQIRDLIEFSEGIARGDFSHGLLSLEEDELNILGRHIVSMARELTNRLKEAEKQIQTFENVLKNMKEGLLIIDEKGRVLLFNDSLKELLGITSTNRELTATEILRDAGLLSLIDDSRLLDKTISREISLRNERYLQATSSPIQLSENERGFIMTFYDITKLKRLEQMRKDFVANVAHEIRTPITAIQGFAETLLDGAIEDKENAIRFLNIIKRHSERLNSLVSDLLTLSAIEQGEIKIEMTDVNLSETIDALFTLMEDKARSKGLYLKRALPEDMPLIRADRDRLFQILLNLIDNAIKFTDSGGVTVGAQKADEKITLFVEDTGCGIEKKHIPRLGERFYRVDRARSRELGGTGLGLAIVKHLVKAHGWHMEIDSTPGKGTKVKIILGSTRTDKGSEEMDWGC